MLTKKTSVFFSLATAVVALMLLIGGHGPGEPQPDAGGFEWGLTTPSPTSPAVPQQLPLT